MSIIEMNPIAPDAIRYVKLGAGGAFARSSLHNGELQLGYHEVPHDVCGAGDWAGILAHFQDIRRTIGKARDSTREVQDFYTLGQDCLWITFTDGYLWWAFAEPEVSMLCRDATSASRARRTVYGWCNTTIRGEPLRMDNMTTRLTQVANYRGTICAVPGGRLSSAAHQWRGGAATPCSECGPQRHDRLAHRADDDRERQ